MPWQGLLTLAAAAAALIWYLPQLDTSRPPERAGYSLPLEGLLVVDGRLWQDPLGAAHAHDAILQGLDPKKAEGRIAREAHLHCVTTLKNEVALEKQPWIVPVMVPGGSYAEYIEARLRARRAVLEGLGYHGYVPEDGEHIGYFRIPWSGSPRKQKGEGVKSDLLVPFEWLKKGRLGSSSDSPRPSPNNSQSKVEERRWFR